MLLTVSDNGVGIPDNFELTETTSLGLQLVFLLTDQLHGKLTVRLANPTSFQLRLPSENVSPAAAVEL